MLEKVVFVVVSLSESKKPWTDDTISSFYTSDGIIPNQL